MFEPMVFALVALPALPLAITIVNLLTWRRGSLALQESLPTISILIPARNEERNLAQVLKSVVTAAKVCPTLQEILVYNDASTDGTARLVEEAAALDSRVRLIQGKELPEGWVGKPHACQKLFEEAQGQMLLFMDADVRLTPSALPRLLSLAESPIGGQVISAVPAQETKTWLERLLLPLLTLTYTAWLPLRLVEVGQSTRTVAANGQLLMIKREDCKSLGGFTQVRHEIVDDVAFCRLAKSRGFKVVFADGFHMARCRMYRSAGEVWRGFSKNLFEGLGGGIGAGFVLLLYLGCFVAPHLALVAFSLSGGETHDGLVAAAALGVTFNVLLRVLLAWRFKQPLEGILLHPISVLALVALAFNSMCWVLQGKIEWAGRSYAARSTRKQAEPS